MYRIVHDHPAFLVIDKAPGIGFHCEELSPGLFATVKEREGLSTLYPVHRLDKVTSGLLVMAKTAAANQQLVDQFAQRLIQKFYLAISDKKPKKKQGTIKGDMEKTRRGAWKLVPARNHPAITQFFSCAMGEGKRVFLIKPLTGKTHQIRVALKSLGAPIWGDLLYGDTESNKWADRTYLHAYSLAFTLDGEKFSYQRLPVTGHYFLTEAFLNAVHSFGDPAELPWPCA